MLGVENAECDIQMQAEQKVEVYYIERRVFDHRLLQEVQLAKVSYKMILSEEELRTALPTRVEIHIFDLVVHNLYICHRENFDTLNIVSEASV